MEIVWGDILLKILFFIPNLAHGGAERVLINLVNHMDYNEFDITVQTMFDVGIYRNKLNRQLHWWISLVF